MDEIWVLDENFKNIYIIDSFVSLIWTESYLGAGEFELYVAINPYIIEIMNFIRSKRKQQLDCYAWMRDSDQVMIFEKIELSTEIVQGGRIIFSGESLESILKRRIVWRQTIINSSFQYAIQRLFNENVQSPTETERRIPNFIFEPSSDERITSLKADTQFTGDNLYEAIYNLCELNSVGFRVLLEDPNIMKFQLYFGEDRSYNQTKNPYVTFSSTFDNLLASNFLEENEDYKNVTLVLGEDDGNSRRRLTIGTASGQSRRELYTDARDIQSEKYEDGETIIIPDEEYFATLRQRGNEKLSEHKETKIFEGEVEALQMFVYGRDFYKGDIVQVKTDYGIESKMRVSQMIRSKDESGYKAYPTFSIIEEDQQ